MATESMQAVYGSLDELLLAYSHRHLETHSMVLVRFAKGSLASREARCADAQVAR